MNAAVITAAAHTVDRVLRAGAYSNVVIRHISRGEASGPQVQALVYSVLRRTAVIDRRIEGHAERATTSIEPKVLDILRVVAAAVGEGHSPVALVVDSAVRAVKQITPKAAGFVNAVSRRLAEAGPFEDTGDVVADLGVPEWLFDHVAGSWGADETSRFFRESAKSPQVGVRVRPGGAAPEASEPVPGVPDAYLFEGGTLGPGVVVQDPASVAVGRSCGEIAGWTVLDMAAAPGTKTLQLVDGGAARVVAMDRHPRRSRDGRKRVPEALWVRGDGTIPPFPDESFDLVLLDAPCSGLGTLRRRPEIRHRVTIEEIRRLARLQTALLDAALRLVKPGGRAVYSVCTVTPEETIDVVAGKGGSAPDSLPGRPYGDGWLMGPHLGPTDGMFLSVFDR